jgi:hypothetical protein
MALRGQGSLQQLVGRAFKRNGFKRQESKDGKDSAISNSALSSGSQRASTNEAEVIEVVEEDAMERVRCPVCRLKLRHDNAAINSHIGKPCKCPY